MNLRYAKMKLSKIKSFSNKNPKNLKHGTLIKIDQLRLKPLSVTGEPLRWLSRGWAKLIMTLQITKFYIKALIIKVNGS